MGNKRKQSPPSTLTEKDTAHLKWIKQNSALLACNALKLHGKSGRGAFLVREQDARPSGTTANYLTVTSVNASGIGWPDERAASFVRIYKPKEEFVVIFQYRSGAARSYLMHFAQTEDTYTVELIP